MFEIGNTLREARLRRGYDIPQCEQETKIRAKYLRAMEEEQFDLMPSPTYVRGFLRTYADFLDLDGQLVLDEYESRFGGFEGARDPDARRGRGQRAAVPPGQYRRDRGRQRGRRRAEPRRTEAQLLWLAIGGVMAVALLVWLGVGNEDVAQPPASPPATQTTGSDTGTTTGEDAVPPAPETIAITLTGVGEEGSYLEVHGRNAQGNRVFVGTLDPGEVQTYTVKRSIYVLVGAPDGLTVAVDGVTQAVSGGVGGYIISRSGVRRVGDEPPPRLRAAILITGDEVLRGRIADQNAAPLARALDERGVALDRVGFVGDALPDLVDALAGMLASGVQVLCVSGGLGPTHDDLTMAAVADATGHPLQLDRAALAMVEAAGTSPGVDPDVARAVQQKQARLPRGAHVLPPVGTAPGCIVAAADALVVVLPGPPWELQAMWEAALAAGPLAERLRAARPPEERLLRLAGIPESRFVAAFDGMDPADRRALAVGVCARDGELEVTVRFDPADTPAADALERALGAEVGDALYSRDGTDLDDAVAALLDRDGATLAVAESCTGGGLGARLTTRGGASARFLGGVISYADEVKRDVLGVDADILRRHGAVSAECAEAMAAGARRLIGTDWALSITGIAGPGGGSAEKPVGLVYIGIAGPDGAASERHRLRGDRERIRARSAALALHLLRRTLAARATA